MFCWPWLISWFEKIVDHFSINWCSVFLLLYSAWSSSAYLLDSDIFVSWKGLISLKALDPPTQLHLCKCWPSFSSEKNVLLKWPLRKYYLFKHAKWKQYLHFKELEIIQSTLELLIHLLWNHIALKCLTNYHLNKCIWYVNIFYTHVLTVFQWEIMSTISIMCTLNGSANFQWGYNKSKMGNHLWKVIVMRWGEIQL